MYFAINICLKIHLFRTKIECLPTILPSFCYFCRHPVLHRADTPHVWLYTVQVVSRCIDIVRRDLSVCVIGTKWPAGRAVHLFFLWSTIDNCWSTTEVVGNFWKIASKWCILVHFEAVSTNFKTENLYEKNCVCLRKDLLLDIDDNLIFFFKFTLVS